MNFQINLKKYNELSIKIWVDIHILGVIIYTNFLFIKLINQVYASLGPFQHARHNQHIIWKIQIDRKPKHNFNTCV